MQHPGAGAPIFFDASSGLDGLRVPLCCFVVEVVLFLMRLVVVPAHNFDIELFQPVPHVPARPAGIAEGGEAAPAEGLDAGEREVVDCEAGEERYVCTLEREAEGEETLKRVIIRGGEVEVFQAGE